MPDFSDDPIKFNPGGAGNPTSQENGGDWTGYKLVGSPRGIVLWAPDDPITLSDVEAAGYIKLDDLPDQILDPYALDGPQGTIRLTDTDGTSIYGMGFGNKAQSGSPAPGEISFFAFENPSALNPEQTLACASWVAVNGTAVPNTTDVEVGFFPITVSGGADDLTYTMSATNKVTNVYTDGLSANTINGFAFADRNADFRAAGTSPVAWAIGCKLSAVLPSGCVLDIRCALRAAPY